jgi:hypothetical protein
MMLDLVLKLWSIHQLLSDCQWSNSLTKCMTLKTNQCKFKTTKTMMQIRIISIMMLETMLVTMTETILVETMLVATMAVLTVVATTVGVMEVGVMEVAVAMIDF